MYVNAMLKKGYHMLSIISDISSKQSSRDINNNENKNNLNLQCIRKMTNYQELSKDELIKLLKQRDEDIMKLKGGYIYMIQFDNNKEKKVSKLGKTSNDTIENRFLQRRNNEMEIENEQNQQMTAINGTKLMMKII